jgi:hypothetical protein
LPDTIQPGYFALIGLVWVVIGLIVFAWLRRRDRRANSIKPTEGSDQEANPTERGLVELGAAFEIKKEPISETE